jgi:hypothetical protein
MVGGLSRPLGIVLLAILAAVPLVRTLCAWDCAAPAASETVSPAGEHAGHCAQPTGGADSEIPGLASVGGCDNCDLIGEALRATVRAESASLTLPLPAPAWLAPGLQLASSDAAVASTRAASPPLRATYPLRI